MDVNGAILFGLYKPTFTSLGAPAPQGGIRLSLPKALLGEIEAGRWMCRTQPTSDRFLQYPNIPQVVVFLPQPSNYL